nr:hypothetical protein [Polyangiaceae bacterium]
LAQTPATQGVASDQVRKAARDLFLEGDVLQKAGKNAEALDRFERSIQLVNAPTTLLRIAECKSALGRFVEASETLRTLSQMELQANANPVFFEAKKKGEKLATEVNAKIATVQISMPAGVKGAQISLDEHSFPEALLGVGTPVNPGQHKLVVNAPGYAPYEQVFSASAGTKVPINVALLPQKNATPIVPVTPAPSNIPAVTPAGTPPQPGPASGSQAYAGGAAGGYGYTPPVATSGPSDMGLLVGLRGSAFLLAAIGGGGAAATPAFPSFGGDLAIRFARNFTVGLGLQFAFAEGATALVVQPQIGYYSGSNSIGFWGQLGVGIVGGAGLAEQGLPTTGLSLSLGVPIKAGPIRIVPRADVISLFAAGGVVLGILPGIGLMYEFELGKKPKAAAPVY